MLTLALGHTSCIPCEWRAQSFLIFIFLYCQVTAATQTVWDAGLWFGSSLTAAAATSQINWPNGKQKLPLKECSFSDSKINNNTKDETVVFLSSHNVNHHVAQSCLFSQIFYFVANKQIIDMTHSSFCLIAEAWTLLVKNSHLCQAPFQLSWIAFDWSGLQVEPCHGHLLVRIEICTVCWPHHWLDLPFLKKSFNTLSSVTRRIIILKNDHHQT